LIPTSTTSGSSPTSTSSGIGSFFSNLAHNVTDEIEGELDDIIGDVADKLAKELGIKQWYSLHLMDFCEGTYAPNATEKGADLNVTECSNQTAMYHFDLSKVLGEQLEVGPLHLNLSDIDWPADIQKGLNALNVATDAMFVHGSRLISFGNWGLASISFLAFLIASVIITIIQKKATHIINKYGNEIGVYAYKGVKYLTITWVAVAVMFLASAAWVVEFCIGRRNKGREYTEKPAHRTGWRHRRSDEAALRRSGV
jgi:hypothetical protein